MIHNIEVPLFWGQTWPGTSLEAGDEIVVTLDEQGNLIDLDGAPEGMESAELTALMAQNVMREAVDEVADAVRATKGGRR